MNAIEIINTILERENIRAGSFAKTIRATPTQIYDLQSGKTKKISESMANKILRSYPHYNRVWLLTGEGSMLKSDSSMKVYQSGMNANYQGTFTEPIHTQIGDGTIVNGEINGVGSHTSYTDKKKDKVKAELIEMQHAYEKLLTEVDYLKRENDGLKQQLSQAIADKEKALAIIDKLLNR